MQCVGKFKFKSIERRSAGQFKDANGHLIKYPESFRLKVDSISEDGINEKIYKISIDNLELVQMLSQIAPYSDIELQFEVKEFGNRVTLVPIGVC